MAYGWSSLVTCVEYCIRVRQCYDTPPKNSFVLVKVKAKWFNKWHYVTVHYRPSMLSRTGGRWRDPLPTTPPLLLYNLSPPL